MMAGRPCEGASESLTLRGIMVLKTFFLKVFGHLANDFLRKPRSCIEHGEQDPADFQVWVDALLHEADGLDDEREPLEREIFALQGNDDLGGRREAIQRKHTERRRTIDEDEIVVVHNRSYCAPKVVVSIGTIDQFNGRPAEVHR